MRASSLTGSFASLEQKAAICSKTVGSPGLARFCHFAFARPGLPRPKTWPFGGHSKTLTFQRENFIFPCRYAASGHIQS